MNDQTASRQRLRLTFAKTEAIKYISHLDLALAWERALRRAHVPLVYSQGFNPRPKMQVASSLPLGSTGRAEILDIIISPAMALDEVLQQIKPALPKGIQLHAIEEVPLKGSALQSLLRQAEYYVTVETGLSAQMLQKRINDLLTAKEIIQTRRRRKRQEAVDIRPWVHELHLESLVEGEVHLYMRLTAGQLGNLRPEDVLKTLALNDNWYHIERGKLIFADDNAAQ